MSKRVALVCAAALASLSGAVPAAPVVLVTGATGRTGALLYGLFKEKGVNVRAFVRNATKAKEVLGCSKCDESEGIYIGYLTDQDVVDKAVQGTTALAVVTSAVPLCPPGAPDPSKCYYPKGAYPVDIDFHGGKAQFKAFAKASKGGHIVLCSSTGTTDPDNFLDKLGNGFISFYKLNEEAFLMSSGLPYTIVKPCGLLDTPAATNELVVGHDDETKLNPPTISRADVARVMFEAVMQPDKASNLRFDLCSKSGPATTDISKVFEAAKYPWQQAHEQAAFGLDASARLSR